MKWSELPQEYRELEIYLQIHGNNNGYDLHSNDIDAKFNWSKSI